MIPLVLAGSKGTGKSSIFSRVSPQASSPTKSGATQTIPPALFSVMTLDFPSPTFSAGTQRDSIPQVLLNAHAIIFCLKDSKDDNLKQFKRLWAARERSPRLFVVLHKIDRVDQQAIVFSEMVATAAEIEIPADHCFATSLFDGSLTRAFSQIVARLLPKFAELRRVVDLFARAFKASRVIVLDGATFLPICDSDPTRTEDPQAIFEFFLRTYPRRNPLQTLTFESSSSVVVYAVISNTAGIFVSSTEPSMTTDAILFNLQRIAPKLKDLVTL
jgi:GTP-binding protein EngB required for normal cell division